MVIIKETGHDGGGGVSCGDSTETGKGRHETAFQGIAKIAIMVVSARRCLHR